MPNINRMQEAGLVEIYLELGHATSAWAFLEAQLSRWFATVSGMPHSIANDIYFSAQSFSARANMVQAAIEHSTVPQDSKAFAVEALKKMKVYSTFRNAFVHGGPPTFDMSSEPVNPRIPEMYGALVRNTTATGISALDLRHALHNFSKLSSLMIDADFEHDLKQHPQPPQVFRTPLPELRKRVEQLPNEPHLSEPSRRQQGRGRQQRAAEQTPIPKRSK
jgi:hypothetical protein